MNSTQDLTFYDRFYAAGGWRYSRVREWWWHRRHFVRRFQLSRGMRLLEVACGMGFHTDLFCRMGFDCAGVDACETAIRLAKERFSGRAFHLADARGVLPFDMNTFDVIVTRGCSLYHYDLSTQPPRDMTANLLRYVKPGGIFVLMIATDLSGRREPGQIWHNQLDDYRAHFGAFDRPCTVDWHKGMAICSVRA